MARRRPLEGVRIADFTWAWAGPWCTTVLGDMGAEIIKIESNVRPDVHRLLRTYADQVPGLNRAGLFNNINRNKLSATINLSGPEGQQLARDLVRCCDVVAENFSPRVMATLGLDYPRLREVRPDLVMVSLSGYGQTGPYRLYPAYGDSMWAFTGAALLTGCEDGPPEMPGIPISDPIVGIHGAFAVLAALHDRERTGQGQYIDVTQLECIMATMPEPVAEYGLNQRQPRRWGNRHPTFAPHGCYPCAGADSWLTIAVTSHDEWSALCRAMGMPRLARDPRFATMPSRWDHQDELDETIAAWTRLHPARNLFLKLQRAGVPAAPTFKVPELLEDPHLNARGFWVNDRHPEVGERIIQGVTWKMSATPGGVERPAPCQGEHNDYVFGELMGLSSPERQRLEASGVIR